MITSKNQINIITLVVLTLPFTIPFLLALFGVIGFMSALGLIMLFGIFLALFEFVVKFPLLALVIGIVSQ